MSQPQHAAPPPEIAHFLAAWGDSIFTLALQGSQFQ